jgi:transcriptional regulator with XRE-family HTH domain
MSAFEGLGKALRWLRDKQSKKQYQVADTAGVTKAMLSAYETGKQKPSLDTLEKILDALQVDLGELFGALETVNERPPQGRSAEPRPAGAGTAGSEVDVYQVLSLDRPLPPLEEEAMAEMLRGFHKLLRYFHQTLAAARAPRENGSAG